MRAYTAGGYSFPLLPSPSVVLTLGLYLFAACIVVQCLRQHNEVSVTLPLVCAGFAMLPAAMGRCDLGHLMSAWPAFLVGIFAIFTGRSLRRWYVLGIWAICLYGVCDALLTTAGEAREAAEMVFLGTGDNPTPMQQFLRSRFDHSPSSHRHLASISSKLTARVSRQRPFSLPGIYLLPATGLPTVFSTDCRHGERILRRHAQCPQPRSDSKQN